MQNKKALSKRKGLICNFANFAVLQVDVFL